jgi:hypothetical protein
MVNFARDRLLRIGCCILLFLLAPIRLRSGLNTCPQTNAPHALTLKTLFLWCCDVPTALARIAIVAHRYHTSKVIVCDAEGTAYYSRIHGDTCPRKLGRRGRNGESGNRRAAHLYTRHTPSFATISLTRLGGMIFMEARVGNSPVVVRNCSALIRNSKLAR